MQVFAGFLGARLYSMSRSVFMNLKFSGEAFLIWKRDPNFNSGLGIFRVVYRGLAR